MPPNPRSRNPEEALKLSLQGGSAGTPQSGLPDRTFIRGQGCWNCINAKPAEERWCKIRNAKLVYAKVLATGPGRSENDPDIVKIRRYIEQVDGMVARDEVFTCGVGRTQTANGTEPVGDFVASAFLCDRWSGRDGASLARAADGKLDPLPEELRDKIDGSAPASLATLKGGES